jgi:acyl-CoA synthetase (NDP forming)
MDKKQFEEMDRIFHPQNIAIIGASPVSDIATQAHMNTKIKDRLYPVNPRYKEVFGRTCYASILDVPVPIDYVILSIGAAMVPSVISDCIKKGVRAAHIYSAGFGETGLKEGIELEKQLQALAKGKIRLIGPNCFGIYCPESGLAIVPESPTESGSIGVITQSGSVAESFSYYSNVKNLRFSKVVSYGNAIDLDCPDFLEYMADDPKTKVIAMYIEGSKDGERLKGALKYATSRKPVVAIKGGLSDNGNRVARSHTGQLTGTPQVWESLFKQCGVLQVSSHDDLVNTMTAFSHTSLPRGNRVALISNSGGFSVIQTDLCASEGLEVPKFADETISKLRKLVPLAGTSIGNPLDAWPVYYKVHEDGGSLADIINIIASDKNIDTLVVQFDQFRYIRRILKQGVGDHVKILTEVILRGVNKVRSTINKPVLFSVILDAYSEDQDERRYSIQMKAAFEKEGYAVYPALDPAMKSVARLYQLAEAMGKIEK